MFTIPTVHPAYILRKAAPITDAILADIRRAARLAEEGAEPDINDNIIPVLPSTAGGLEAAVRAARGWMRHWRTTRCPVAVDVETGSLRYMTARLYSIALSGADGNRTGVAFTFHDLHTLPHEAERVLVQDMRELLADPNVPVVAHNAPFDLSVLEARGYKVNGPLLDTMAMHHLVQPDEFHNLGWVAHRYLDTDPWKLGEEGEKLATVKDVVTLVVYNAKDAIRTAQLVDPLREDIYERGMNDRLISYQMALMRLASRMQLRGIPVNMETRARRGADLQKEIQQHKAAMRLFLDREGLGFQDFDPDKRAHLVDVLYGKKYLGFTPARYTPKSGEPGVSYKDFAEFADHPFVYNLILYVEKRVQYTTTYAHKTKAGDLTAFSRALHADNRLHVHWGMGTKGSRFTSKPNVQNDPIVDRIIYEAPDGWTFVGVDKDQLELRIIAGLAGVPALVKGMQEPGFDPHSMIAEMIYQAEFRDASPAKRKDIRGGTKTVTYASLYNAGPERIFQTIRTNKKIPLRIRAMLDRETVAYIHAGIFGNFVEIPDFHQTNLRIASQPPYRLVIQPLGRTRYFPIQPPPFTELGNWPIQTYGSDVVGMEMVHIQDRLDRECPGAEIIIHGHDAVYIECRTSHAEQVRQVVDEEFGATPLDGPCGRLFLTGKAKIKNRLDLMG